METQQRSEPCPTCNATECKRWQMLSGQWVCDECWLDVAMDIQQHHFRIAEAGVKTRAGCASVGSSRGSKCSSVLSVALRTVKPRWYETTTTRQDSFGASCASCAIHGSASTKPTSGAPGSARSSEGGTSSFGGSQPTSQLSTYTCGRTLGTATGMGRTSTRGQRVQDYPNRFRLPLTHRLRKSLDAVVKPGYNSVCLLCSHIFYGASMASCSRCGGLCQLRTDHDLQLQTRRPLQVIEAEK